MSKLEQRKLEKDITGFFTEAKAEKNPILKAQKLKEVYNFFNDIPVLPSSLENLKKTVFSELKTASNDVQVKIEESLKIEEEIGVKSVDDMKAGLDKLAEATFTFNENAEHWKKVAGNLQKRVNELKAKLSANPSIKDYEAIVEELEKTDKATRKIVESQNKKLYNLKKRLFEERNLSRKLEKEASELKIQLTGAVKNKKSYKDKANQYKEAYQKVLKRNKQLSSEKKQILEQVEEFLNGDMYRFGRDQVIPGSPSAKIKESIDFSEKQYVDSYFEDLKLKYGEDIEPYRERITSRKTVKEAMTEFQKCFVEMDSIHVPKGIEGEERKAYLREHGIVIKKKNKLKESIQNMLNNYKEIGN